MSDEQGVFEGNVRSLRLKLVDEAHTRQLLPVPFNAEPLGFAINEPSLFYRGPTLLEVYPDTTFLLEFVDGRTIEGVFTFEDGQKPFLNLETKFWHQRKDLTLETSPSAQPPPLTVSWSPFYSAVEVKVYDPEGSLVACLIRQPRLSLPYQSLDRPFNIVRPSGQKRRQRTIVEKPEKVLLTKKSQLDLLSIHLPSLHKDKKIRRAKFREWLKACTLRDDLRAKVEEGFETVPSTAQGPAEFEEGLHPIPELRDPDMLGCYGAEDYFLGAFEEEE